MRTVITALLAGMLIAAPAVAQKKPDHEQARVESVKEVRDGVRR